MKNLKIFKSTPTKVVFTLIISFVLIFLLYETIYLEKKIEKNMFDISTSDVLSITENNADFIKSLFKTSDNYADDMKNNKQLQNKIENKLKLLITNNIKYAINDNKGIVTKPNQFIYSVEQGTPLTHGTTDSGIISNIKRLW